MKSDPQKGKTRARGRKTAHVNDYIHPLDYYFQLFIRAKETEGLRPKSILGYRNSYKYFQKWLLQQYPKLSVSEFAADHIRQYILYMQHERPRFTEHPRLRLKYQTDIGLAAKTISVRTNFMKALFTFMYREGHIQTDIGSLVKVVKSKDDTVEAFTKEEMMLLLTAPNKEEYTGFRDYVLMFFLFDTGMRINETLLMKISNIDFIHRIIHIPAEDAKNGKPRSVPFTKKTKELLQQLIEENETMFGKQAESVFLSNYGEPLSQNQAYCRIREHGEQVGLKHKRVSPHIFRHTFSKMYILNGGDLFTLQKILGHSDLSMVRKYVQMNPDDLRKQHDTNSPMSQF
ncbi:tyrosine-type recombinase/integrase [Paenibacillus hamazuiensis]|uniref:tyrosine-type recombinase/integrase n=1 Tax=Paenibacillus hamazuiensis TaxID=2936508 RepID=UPI0020100EB0|nr:tyrosine-type recombinase/integrase [Paenibacillus hamazuiensis]